MYEIIEKRTLTPVTKVIVIAAPLVARAAKAGQFVMLRARSSGERIPVTITDFDAEKGTITIVVQEVGVTSKMIGALEVGESFTDFAGPMGEPITLAGNGHTICVGGGFGAGAILTILKALKDKPGRTTAIVGARNAELLILGDVLEGVADQIFLCTDDGSKGYKGFVTGKLQELINAGETIDEVIAVGPMMMMRAVAGVTTPAGIKTQVSLDPIMVDGTGMCGACRVTVDGETLFACVDGPFFEAAKANFDELVRRNRIYKDEEADALNRYNSECHRPVS